MRRGRATWSECTLVRRPCRAQGGSSRGSLRHHGFACSRRAGQGQGKLRRRNRECTVCLQEQAASSRLGSSCTPAAATDSLHVLSESSSLVLPPHPHPLASWIISSEPAAAQSVQADVPAAAVPHERPVRRAKKRSAARGRAAFPQPLLQGQGKLAGRAGLGRRGSTVCSMQVGDVKAGRAIRPLTMMLC